MFDEDLWAWKGRVAEQRRHLEQAAEDTDFLLDVVGDLERELRPLKEMVWGVLLGAEFHADRAVKALNRMEDVLGRVGPKRLIEMAAPFDGLRDEDHSVQNDAKMVDHE